MVLLLFLARTLSFPSSSVSLEFKRKTNALTLISLFLFFLFPNSRSLFFSPSLSFAPCLVPSLTLVRTRCSPSPFLSKGRRRVVVARARFTKRRRRHVTFFSSVFIFFRFSFFLADDTFSITTTTVYLHVRVCARARTCYQRKSTCIRALRGYYAR